MAVLPLSLLSDQLSYSPQCYEDGWLGWEVLWQPWAEPLSPKADCHLVFVTASCLVPVTLFRTASLLNVV